MHKVRVSAVVTNHKITVNQIVIKTICLTNWGKYIKQRQIPEYCTLEIDLDSIEPREKRKTLNSKRTKI